MRAAGLTGRVTCTGGNWAMLAGIHRAEPGIRAGLTMPRRIWPRAARPLQRLWYAWRAPALLAAYDAQLVSCHRLLVSRLLVHRLHAAGAEIWVWTVDQLSEIDRLRELERRRHLLGRSGEPRLGGAGRRAGRAGGGQVASADG